MEDDHVSVPLVPFTRYQGEPCLITSQAERMINHEWITSQGGQIANRLPDQVYRASRAHQSRESMAGRVTTPGVADLG